jgi:hypothetical protein
MYSATLKPSNSVPDLVGSVQLGVLSQLYNKFWVLLAIVFLVLVVTTKI